MYRYIYIYIYNIRGVWIPDFQVTLYLPSQVRDMLAHAARHPGTALLMLPADVSLLPHAGVGACPPDGERVPPPVRSCTLFPPSTLNPQPSTLNPKPSTPNPTP